MIALIVYIAADCRTISATERRDSQTEGYNTFIMRSSLMLRLEKHLKKKITYCNILLGGGTISFLQFT
jgi:hypothetical protein